MLDTKARKFFDPLFDKLANTFIKFNIKPNQITTLSLIIGLLSAISYYFDYIILSILLLWISGLFDVLDGTVSRKTNSSSSLLGTLYDIVFDRIVELSIILSIALKNNSSIILYGIIVLLISIVLSMTTFLTTGLLVNKKSYKTFYYQPGLAERSEGFIFLTIMIIFKNYIFPISLLFSALIFITFIQRLFEAIKYLGSD